MRFKSFVLLFFFLITSGTIGAQPFWDLPYVIAKDGARFPQTAQGGNLQVVAWQDRKNEGGWPQYWVSLGILNPQGKWDLQKEKIGPIQIPGDESSLYSLVVTPGAEIYISILQGNGQVEIYKSKDRGKTFLRDQVFTSSSAILTPKLYLNSQGKPILIATIADDTTFKLAGAFPKSDGTWGALNPLLKPTSPAISQFSPTYVFFQGREMIFYQSRVRFTYGPSGPTQTILTPFQIFMVSSSDQGKTWSNPRGITDKVGTDPQTGGIYEPGRFDNQRPTLHTFQNKLYLGWERSQTGEKGAVRIATAPLDFNYQVDPKDITEVSPTGTKAGSPQYFLFQNHLYLFWFDNRRERSALFLAKQDPNTLEWLDESRILPDLGGESLFGRPLVVGNELYFFWENTVDPTLVPKHSIMVLGPDRRTEIPKIIPMNFKENQKSAQGKPEFRLEYPPDPSGIAGFSYLWDQNPSTEAPETLDLFSPQERVFKNLDGEGTWYLHVKSKDRAGNWSDNVTLSFILDTTPPRMVEIIPPLLDPEGFLNSNTGVIQWKKTDEDTQSVLYRLEFLGPLGSLFENLPIPNTSGGFISNDYQMNFTNLENGIYALSLNPRDEAGNQGPDSRFYFRVNKFRPYTAVFSLKTQLDEFSRLKIEIQGRGFSSEGVVQKVIFDKDGQLPWDYEITGDRFSLTSDRLIQNILLENLNPGLYRVGVIHSQRGLVFAPGKLIVDESGTIKFGDFRDDKSPDYDYPKAWASLLFSSQSLVYWLIMAFLILIFIFTSGKIFALIREGRTIKLQALQIFENRFLLTDTKLKGVQSMAKQGLSLRVKFIISILTLTTTVILMISIAMGVFITFNSQRSLGVALKQRAEVLLDSLVTSASNYMPSGEEFVSDLKAAGDQIKVMDDAISTVLQGPSSKGLPGLDYIYWASENQLSNIDLKNNVNRGVARLIQDPLASVLPNLQKTYEEKAAQVGFQDLKTQIQRLNAQAEALLAQGDSPAQKAELEKINAQFKPLQDEVKIRLKNIRIETESFPNFEPEKITQGPEKYLFYKPILYSVTKDNFAYHGTVRLEVSVKNILKDISDAQNQLIIITGIIALAGLLLALGGAWILARMTVNPIDKLVAGVKVIRDTENMKSLAGYEIQVGSKDELATLAQTINEMTHSLVKAAEAAEDLTVGKDTQKIFIPLQLSSQNLKTTISHQEFSGIEFFGYYEGAKGVSGDYFSYQPLIKNKGDKPRYFSVIKCDVAGKGVPAALVMVQMATIYMNHFRNFEKIHQKNFLTDLAYEANSILSSMNFVGRFAAFTVAIIDQETGVVRMTNAGDSICKVYRAGPGKLETHRMQSGPAAGQIDPADMELFGVKYVEYQLKLEKGDTLLLYTDGIEEAKRFFRDLDFNILAFTNPDDPNTRTDLEAKEGIKDEELTAEKVDKIIEAAFHKERFTLEKRHNPRPDIPLEFDFSKGDGTLRDVVLSMVSVEKIWRLIPDPNAGPKDKVIFDKEVESYIRKTLITQSEILPVQGKNESRVEYISFDHLREDNQYDDLTILGIQRK